MRRLGIGLTAAVALVVVVSTAGDASHAYPGRPHWGGTAAVHTVPVVDSVNAKWDAALRDAAVDWSVGAVQVVVNDGATGKRTRRKCAFGNREIHVCNYRYGKPWAGLAEIEFNGNGHITKARIRFDDPVSADVRAAVACHEVGHTLGLGHYSGTQPNDSCMRTPAKASAEDPSSHDRQDLATSYGHIDSAGTFSSPASSIWWDDPLVRVTRNGDITRVTWILPDR